MRFLSRLARVAALFFLISCQQDAGIEELFFQSQVTWVEFTPQSPQTIPSLHGLTQTRWSLWPWSVRASDLASVGPAVFAAVSGSGIWEIREEGPTLRFSPVEGSSLLGGYTLGEFFPFQENLYIHVYEEPRIGYAPRSPSVSLAWFHPAQKKLILQPLASQVSDPAKQAVRVMMDQPGQLLMEWKKPAAEGWVFSWSRYDLATGEEHEGPGSDHLASGVSARDQSLSEPSGAGWEAPELALLEEIKASAPLGTSLVLWKRDPDGAGRKGWKLRSGSQAFWDLFLVGDSKGLILVSSSGLLFYQRSPSPGGPSQPAVKRTKLPPLGTLGVYTGAAWLDDGVLVSWEHRHGPFTGPAGLLYFPVRLLQ